MLLVLDQWLGGEIMKKFKVTIIVEVENQSVEDMEFNAQGYIKHDIEDNALYIEDIEEIVVEE